MWIKQGFDPVTWNQARGTTHLPVGSLNVHLMGSRATQKWIHHDTAAVEASGPERALVSADEFPRPWVWGKFVEARYSHCNWRGLLSPSLWLALSLSPLLGGVRSLRVAEGSWLVEDGQLWSSRSGIVRRLSCPGGATASGADCPVSRCEGAEG